MTAYLYTMNDMPDVFSATEDNFRGNIYKCQAGIIAQVGFKCLPTFSDLGVNGDPTSLYSKLLQAMKPVEAKYETDICRSFTSSTKTMQLLAMLMLKSTVLFVRDIMYYMSNNYTTPIQAFSSTT